MGPPGAPDPPGGPSCPGPCVMDVMIVPATGPGCTPRWQFPPRTRTLSPAPPTGARPAAAWRSGRTRRRRPARAGPPGKADAVVAHIEGHLVLHVGEGQADPRGIRVPGHVRDRLLRGPPPRDL